MDAAARTTRTDITIAGIGGLRALAVLSVVLFHVHAAWLPGGFVGVDVFFVISGFVVAHSVHGKAQASFRDYYLWFYRRRFLRILPAILLFVLVAAFLGVLFIPAAPASKFIELTGIASIFGASNFALLWKAGDYFAASTEYNTFTHTWSLAVEEQYYLLFPFFSYAIIVRQWASPAPRRFALALVALASVVSLGLCAATTAAWREFAFYMLPTRFWELGLGFLLRVLGEGRLPRPGGVADRCATVGSLAAFAGLAVAFIATDPTRFPFPGALLPCIATAALVWVVWRFPAGIANRILTIRPLPFFGEISYSLYLWHWGVVVLMRWTTGIGTLPLELSALGLMFALACASYYLVERPLRYDRRVMALETPAFFGA
jgi:peptidoglycan/LPS O-acetylase OafA/YrhL